MQAVKTFVLALAFGFAAIAANAQISQGTMFIGGEAFFGSSSFEPEGGEKGTVSTALFGPKFGYFVADNIAVGVQAQIGSVTADENSTFSGLEEVTSEFNVGVFGRYYNMFNDQIGLFGEVNALYSSSNFEVDGTEFGSTNGIDANLNLGFAFFPSNRFALEGTLGILGFSSETEEDADGNELGTSSSFGIGVGSFNIGITAAWYFNR